MTPPLPRSSALVPTDSFRICSAHCNVRISQRRSSNLGKCAAACGLRQTPVRTAQRAIKALCERGVLVKTSPRRPGTTKTSDLQDCRKQISVRSQNSENIRTLSSPVCHQTGANLSHTGDRLSDDSRTDSRFNSFPPSALVSYVRNTTPRSAMRLTGANSALPGKSCS